MAGTYARAHTKLWLAYFQYSLIFEASRVGECNPHPSSRITRRTSWVRWWDELGKLAVFAFPMISANFTRAKYGSLIMTYYLIQAQLVLHRERRKVNSIFQKGIFRIIFRCRRRKGRISHVVRQYCQFVIDQKHRKGMLNRHYETSPVLTSASETFDGSSMSLEFFKFL